MKTLMKAVSHRCGQFSCGINHRIMRLMCMFFIDLKQEKLKLIFANPDAGQLQFFS
jgi:hypothetical protein